MGSPEKRKKRAKIKKKQQNIRRNDARYHLPEEDDFDDDEPLRLWRNGKLLNTDELVRIVKTVAFAGVPEGASKSVVIDHLGDENADNPEKLYSEYLAWLANPDPEYADIVESVKSGAFDASR